MICKDVLISRHQTQNLGSVDCHREQIFVLALYFGLWATIAANLVSFASQSDIGVYETRITTFVVKCF